MTGSIEDFYRDLSDLVQRHGQRGLALKIEGGADSGIIKVCDQRITPLARARAGLRDVAELAHATAEHHPYWQALSGCSDIADPILERWNDSLSAEDISEIDWALRNLNAAMDRIKDDSAIPDSRPEGRPTGL